LTSVAWDTIGDVEGWRVIRRSLVKMTKPVSAICKGSAVRNTIALLLFSFQTLQIHTISKMSDAEWTEMFRMLDEKGSGKIPAEKFGTAVRAAGQYPTETQLEEMLAKADPGKSGTVSLDNYLEQMKVISESAVLDLDKIGESFKMFDKDGNGQISKSELSHVLTSMGEKMSKEQVDEFIKSASIDDAGNIDYMAFLKAVTE
jgi:calmodulin